VWGSEFTTKAYTTTKGFSRIRALTKSKFLRSRDRLNDWRIGIRKADKNQKNAASLMIG